MDKEVDSNTIKIREIKRKDETSRGEKVMYISQSKRN